VPLFVTLGSAVISAGYTLCKKRPAECRSASRSFVAGVDGLKGSGRNQENDDAFHDDGEE
jgi:hypothetical protein